jgi:hypothetical protein
MDKFYRDKGTKLFLNEKIKCLEHINRQLAED